jgi:hypothetical protein
LSTEIPSPSKPSRQEYPSSLSEIQAKCFLFAISFEQNSALPGLPGRFRIL